MRLARPNTAPEVSSQRRRTRRAGAQAQALRRDHADGPIATRAAGVLRADSVSGKAEADALHELLEELTSPGHRGTD